MKLDLVKYLFDIEKYFDRSMDEIIINDDCLPYVADGLVGAIYVLDYERRIPETFEQYIQMIQPAFNELIIRGMFDPKKQVKAY